MKPCSKNRKLIAWLALDALDAESAAALREHLGNCDGCRGYLNELSKVTATLSAAEIRSDIQATESFHRHVVAGIKAREARFTRQTMGEFLQATLLDWRVALPVVCGFLVVLLVGLLLVPRQAQAPLPISPVAQTASEHIREADFPPTVGNYHVVASRSLESLDEVLTEQASRRVLSVPLYTASTLATGSLSD